MTLYGMAASSNSSARDITPQVQRWRDHVVLHLRQILRGQQRLELRGSLVVVRRAGNARLKTLYITI